MATRRKLRILTVADIFSLVSPAVDPRLNYRGEDVVETLENLCKEIGYPEPICADKGSVFTSRYLDLRAHQNGAPLGFARPRKPSDTAFMECVYGRSPLATPEHAMVLFLDGAKTMLERRRRQYNEPRPHGAINNKPPITLANHASATSPPL